MSVRNSVPTGPAAVPDSRGLNLYRADPALARLASLYLPSDLLQHLAPHLDRLGGLAGGRLDELATAGDHSLTRAGLS